MPNKLPEFKGYTVDFRLNEFRKVDYTQKEMEFIDFETEKGSKLLKEYLKTIQ